MWDYGKIYFAALTEDIVVGVSTDGEICYGIKYEEGYEFPWYEVDLDIEDWWIYEVHGFKHSVEIYDEHGEYINGTIPPVEQIHAYFNERDNFKKEHPLPVELVNYCSEEYPEYILAVPSSLKTASRGYPVEINPSGLVVSEEEKAALVAFCNQYAPGGEDGPKWWLSSYWG